MLVAMGGWQVAERAFAASPAVITGCYQTKGDDHTGQLRIVGAASDCRKSETSIQWNESGPAGPQGPTGPAGPAGPVGPAGAIADMSCPSGQFVSGYAGGAPVCGSPPAPPTTHTLTLSVFGSGTVTSIPAGINCSGGAAGGMSGVCSAAFPAGSTVQLTAVPSGAHVSLLQWQSACVGNAPQCSVAMTSNRAVNAIFDPLPVLDLSHAYGEPLVFVPGQTRTFSVANIGVALSGPVSISPSSPNFFLVGVDSCSGTMLLPGQTCTFSLSFTPPAGALPGYFEAASVTAWAIPGGSDSVAFSGEVPVS